MPVQFAPSFKSCCSSRNIYRQHVVRAVLPSKRHAQLRTVVKTANRGVVCDLDGVMYHGDKAIRGAAEMIQWFNNNHVPFLFLTNTTTKTRQGLAEKLNSLGVECSPSHFVTPTVLARKWLAENCTGPVALLVDDGVLSEFEGLEVVDVHCPSSIPAVRAVVIGDMGLDWSYTKLNQAFRMLMAPTKPTLISLGMTRYYKDADGLSLDVGPFTAALQFATGCHPMVLGKPDANIFKLAADSLQVPRDCVVMIGDDVQSDVVAAKRAGLKGVLVRTGKYRQGDGEGLEQADCPDAILDSVADFPQWMEEQVMAAVK